MLTSVRFHKYGPRDANRPESVLDWFRCSGATSSHPLTSG